MAVVGADEEDFRIETREASPAHLLIKIESFSLLSKHGIEKYESREFTAGDYKWKLVIHPNGTMESGNEDDHISVYWTIVKTDNMPMDWEVNAICSIFLHNQILDNYICFQGKMRRFHAMKTQWGFSKLISKESLRAPGNGFLVDDNCVFGAEVAILQKSQRVIECMSLLNTTYPRKLDWRISEYSKLQEVWSSEEFNAGDHKWMIQLYPNGRGKREGYVSISLSCITSESLAPHEKVKADYCILIRNQLNRNQHSIALDSDWFESSPSGRSGFTFSSFIGISDMLDPKKGFVVEDCCIVEVEISVRAVVRV